MSRRLAIGLAVLLALAIALPPLAGWADRRYPPDLSRLERLSSALLDRDGRPLRTYLSADGFLRLPAESERVEPRYLEMLIAYEDKRFRRHAGVDPLALLRALGQALAAGRVVSGASTLTMQVARLLEPRPRTLRSKLIEMARAWQLERRYGKDQILSIYLTLAPFGGNREGVEAAARSYFGQSAQRLSPAQAALLVALPQAPTRLRPDRHPEAARAARNKVLARVAERIGLSPADLRAAQAEPLRLAAGALSFAAPHFADHAMAGRALAGRSGLVESSLDGPLQRALEGLARAEARRLGPRASLAILVVENRGRRIAAYLGSADFRDDRRQGQVDMVRALRSPGSTLKPALYALAFQRKLLHPATLMSDVPTQFGDYAPANFMKRHFGAVTATEALQLSLNVPAVAVLERLGPVSVTERLRRAGLALRFGAPDTRPGLALALGGVGVTLEGLVRLYAALADDGRLRPLSGLATAAEAGAQEAEPLFGPAARWYVGEILRGVRPPEDHFPDLRRRQARHIAYKTGTSYGFRDAWAIGYTPRHTVGVWVGRPDGTPSPGRYGANTAAPLLFQVFDHLGGETPAPAARPDGALALGGQGLPPALRRFSGAGLAPPSSGRPAPRILFPLDRARIALPAAGRPLLLEAEGGARPLTWLVDGAPLVGRARGARAQWRPDGPGFSRVVLVDAEGRRSEARVQLVEGLR